MGNNKDLFTIEMDELMEEYCKSGFFNGSLLVSHGKNIMYKRGLGFADFESQIPNQADTRHCVGSLAEQFTSMLIMQLAERGKINLYSNISDYLDYYRKDIGERVTIYHLLTNTSGIPEYTIKTNVIEKEITNKDFIMIYCSGDLDFVPGIEFKFSNSAYFILNGIIEAVTSKSFYQVLKENILVPLKMLNTGYNNEKHSFLYEKNNGSYTRISSPIYFPNLYSTVEDLYIWEQALYTEKLLSKEYMDILFKPCIKRHCCGWISAKLSKNRIREFINNPSELNDEYDEYTKCCTVTYYTGCESGISAIILRVIEKKQTIILISNSVSSNFDIIVPEIIDILNCPPFANA